MSVAGPSLYEVVLTDPAGVGAVCQILNLSRTSDGRADRVEMTLQDSPQLRTFLAVGMSYRVQIRQVLPSGTLPRYDLSLILTNVDLQATRGAISNLSLRFVEDFRPSELQLGPPMGRTFGGPIEPETMPKPPKFKTPEEADAWLEQHRGRAQGALSELKQKGLI